MSHDTASTLCGHVLRALVERAVARDPDAWEQLYRRSYRNLFGFARRRLVDDHAADDVVSETMARTLDNIDRFTWQGGGFDAWLYGIARNVVFEFARRDARIVVSIDCESATIERGPEEHAVASDEAATVRRAFGRLDPDERELLELRVQGGLSSEEVGHLLGKQPGAVRMAQARALHRLRTILEELT
jgi:RNA polymerase sigma-70 factor (ECF subfamily)